MEITIKARRYTVEAVESKGARIGYVLTGARGAQYGILRHYQQPQYLSSYESRGAMQGVIFTDANGTLEVVRG